MLFKLNKPPNNGSAWVPFKHVDTQMALQPAVFMQPMMGASDLVLSKVHAPANDSVVVGAAVEVVGANVMLVAHVEVLETKSE
jgi:hypothetical protein